MSYLPFFPFSYSMGKGEEDAGGSIVKTGGGGASNPSYLQIEDQRIYILRGRHPTPHIFK